LKEVSYRFLRACLSFLVSFNGPWDSEVGFGAFLLLVEADGVDGDKFRFILWGTSVTAASVLVGVTYLL
jgi:hypothetical protein